MVTAAAVERPSTKGDVASSHPAAVQSNVDVEESQKPSSPVETAREKFEKHATDHLVLQ